MAAAEARAVWQRAANRCFVQEDAKRAPKLACCQSSSSSSKPVDVEPTSEADGHDHSVSDFKPINRAPSNSDLPPDTRWWLKLQPTYGYKKGLTHEKLNALETEVEMLRAGIGNSTSKFGKDDLLKKDSPKIDEYNTAEFSAEIHRRASNVGIRKEYEVRKKGVKSVCSKNTEELESIDLGDSYEKPETNSLGCSDSTKASELGFDPESPWIRSEKTDPWWRVTDKNDLASFVAQKSLDHIQNCDLPPAQKMHVQRSPYSGLGRLNHDEILASSLDWKAETGAVSNDGLWTAVIERVQYEPDKSFRTSNLRRRYIHTQKESTKTQLSESDPSKAQLLAALQRSQTRAREAEKAAEQAYAEKEHVIKLFFRQASQLFAYRQWLQILQLESLYLQIKNNEQPISSLFPVPWIPLRAKKVKRKWEKRKRGTTQNIPIHDIGKFSVALALGLSLVGAGLHESVISGMFKIVRPTVGESIREMPLSELKNKYRKLTSLEKAQSGWEDEYDVSSKQCMHGPNCKLGNYCTVGRRLQEVNVLGGLILPIWGTIEKALSKQARQSHKRVRVVRIETTTDNQRIVGLLVPNAAVEAVLQDLAWVQDIDD